MVSFAFCHCDAIATRNYPANTGRYESASFVSRLTTHTKPQVVNDFGVRGQSGNKHSAFRIDRAFEGIKTGGNSMRKK